MMAITWCAALPCVCPWKVTLDGIPKNPEELDNYYKNKGPIPKFSNEFGCITDVVKYVANDSALGELFGTLVLCCLTLG